MSDQPEHKPTIDERLEALTSNGELLQGMMRDLIAKTDAYEKRMQQQDERERHHRKAILRGIVEYLQALNNGETN